MTLIPTHLSLEALLFWVVLPKSEKQEFEQKKGLFWVVLAFTIFPDLDIFIGLHRGIFHSIIPPVLFAALGISIYYYYSYKNALSVEEDINKGKKGQFMGIELSFIGRCLLYAGILWIIHIFLDLEYPLALFYPLSDRLYQLDFVYILDLRPLLIFPAMIIGFSFEIRGVSYLEGIASYFINLPPSKRQQIFGGTTATIAIEDFFLQVILFILFLIFVAKPMAPTVNIEKISRLKPRIKYDTPMILFGLILLILGLLLGPMIGFYDTEINSINSTFQISQNVFSPTLALTFDSTEYLFQPNTPLYVTSTLKIDLKEDFFNHTLLITRQISFMNFTSEISDLFLEIPLNSSENLEEFRENYKNLLSELYRNSLSMNSTKYNVTQLENQLTGGSYALVGVIDSWNFTRVLNGTNLLENVELQAKLISSRITVYVAGLIFVGIGIIVIIYSYKVNKQVKPN